MPGILHQPIVKYIANVKRDSDKLRIVNFIYTKKCLIKQLDSIVLGLSFLDPFTNYMIPANRIKILLLMSTI